MPTTTSTDPEPLVCPTCGTDALVLAYQAPVYLLIKAGVASRVVVADEEVEFKGRTWCRRCGEVFHPAEEPDTGTWPAWEVGW